MYLFSNWMFDLNVAKEMSQLLNIEQHIVNTCIRVFISRKKNAAVSLSTRNSIVPISQVGVTFEGKEMRTYLQIRTLLSGLA